MATLGNVPAEAYTNTVKDSFSGNGSATAFTMSLPTVTNDVRVVVENVIQDPTVAYSVSGTTLTFTSAPPTGTNNIYVVHLGPAVMTTVPPAEIADATTFASSLTVQGAFTSKGIDDNADAVALTIDSSENVLIGKTAAGIANAGSEFSSDGRAFFTFDNGGPLQLNRLTGDGDIIELHKDGTEVGSIGTSGGDLIISGRTSSAKSGIRFDNNTITPAVNGADVDASVDLGYSSRRFKDAYLSGGIYLGGAVAANKLDDYEEGTWTPTLLGASSNPTVGYVLQTGHYTKIGNTVNLYCRLQTNSRSGGSGTALIGNLPVAHNSARAGGSVGYVSSVNLSSGYAQFGLSGDVNSSTIRYVQSGDNVGANVINVTEVASAHDIVFTYTYQTNS